MSQTVRIIKNTIGKVYFEIGGEDFKMEDWKACERYCQNCGKKIKGYRNIKGVVKMSCPRCGVLYVSKRVSRRKEVVEVTAPRGEDIT